jgi:hypothetical protein
MDSRYSWKQMPDNYNANYYNDIDLTKNRSFVVIDNVTGREYDFPVYETKNDIYGREHRVNMIASSLWNQEFFNWICSTAPDFGIYIPKEFMTPELIDICIEHTSHANFIKEIPNLTQEQCSRFVKRLPSAIYYIPDDYKTREMAIQVTNKRPDLLTQFDKSLVTPELCQKCYDKVDKNTKIMFVERGYMTDLMTSDIAKEIIENDSDCISFIPEEFITEDMCRKSVTDNRKNISFLPLKFQTFDFQKIAIDQDYRVISSIPEEKLSDEIILYAINKNGHALSGLPEERKTPEFCELAVSKNPKAFRYVPSQYKTYEMCKTVVMNDPSLIKLVPVEILTRDFFTELQKSNIVIPDNCMGYVKECLKAHDSMAGITNPNINSDNKESELPKTEIPVDIKNISLNSLAVFFSQATLKLFETYGITNLEQLFKIASTSDYVKYFGSSAIYNELTNTIRLLKCKYLGQTPLIDINDEQMEWDELYYLLGLSTRSRNCLKRCGFCKNAKEYFERMQNPRVEESLMRVRNMGANGLKEIMQKTNIILNYYESHKVAETDPTKLEENEIPKNDNVSTRIENDTAESLNAELQRLREERKKIDEQIDIVLAKIQEKMLAQSKGGALK